MGVLGVYDNHKRRLKEKNKKKTTNRKKSERPELTRGVTGLPRVHSSRKKRELQDTSGKKKKTPCRKESFMPKIRHVKGPRRVDVALSTDSGGSKEKTPTSSRRTDALSLLGV